MHDDHKVNFHDYKDVFRDDFNADLDSLLGDPFFEPSGLASSHEATGLIPSLDTNEAAAEFHSELYGIHKQKVDD